MQKVSTNEINIVNAHFSRCHSWKIIVVNKKCNMHDHGFGSHPPFPHSIFLLYTYGLTSCFLNPLLVSPLLSAPPIVFKTMASYPMPPPIHGTQSGDHLSSEQYQRNNFHKINPPWWHTSLQTTFLTLLGSQIQLCTQHSMPWWKDCLKMGTGHSELAWYCQD